MTVSVEGPSTGVPGEKQHSPTKGTTCALQNASLHPEEHIHWQDLTSSFESLMKKKKFKLSKLEGIRDKIVRNNKGLMRYVKVTVHLEEIILPCVKHLFSVLVNLGHKSKDDRKKGLAVHDCLDVLTEAICSFYYSYPLLPWEDQMDDPTTGKLLHSIVQQERPSGGLALSRSTVPHCVDTIMKVLRDGVEINEIFHPSQKRRQRGMNTCAKVLCATDGRGKLLELLLKSMNNCCTDSRATVYDTASRRRSKSLESVDNETASNSLHSEEMGPPVSRQLAELVLENEPYLVDIVVRYLLPAQQTRFIPLLILGLNCKQENVAQICSLGLRKLSETQFGHWVFDAITPAMFSVVEAAPKDNTRQTNKFPKKSAQGKTKRPVKFQDGDLDLSLTLTKPAIFDNIVSVIRAMMIRESSTVSSACLDLTSPAASVKPRAMTIRPRERTSLFLKELDFEVDVPSHLLPGSDARTSLEWVSFGLKDLQIPSDTNGSNCPNTTLKANAENLPGQTLWSLLRMWSQMSDAKKGRAAHVPTCITRALLMSRSHKSHGYQAIHTQEGELYLMDILILTSRFCMKAKALPQLHDALDCLGWSMNKLLEGLQSDLSPGASPDQRRDVQMQQELLIQWFDKTLELCEEVVDKHAGNSEMIVATCISLVRAVPFFPDLDDGGGSYKRNRILRFEPDNVISYMFSITESVATDQNTRMRVWKAIADRATSAYTPIEISKVIISKLTEECLYSFFGCYSEAILQILIQSQRFLLEAGEQSPEKVFDMLLLLLDHLESAGSVEGSCDECLDNGKRELIWFLRSVKSYRRPVLKKPLSFHMEKKDNSTAQGFENVGREGKWTSHAQIVSLDQKIDLLVEHYGTFCSAFT